MRSIAKIVERMDSAMLGTALRLLRPSYALTALLLFGGWQGYGFVKSIPERLPDIPGLSVAGTDSEPGEAEADGADDASAETPPDSPMVAAVRDIHPAKRIIYWAIGYSLLCLGTVPLIQRALSCESNAVNAVMLVAYCAVGVVAAMALVAFHLTWLTGGLWVVVALVGSVALMVGLAGELERMRVEDRLM